MKLKIFMVVLSSALMFMLAGVEAFAQQQEQPDIYEQAETEDHHEDFQFHIS